MTIVRDTLRGLLTEPNRSLWEGGREEEGGKGERVHSTLHILNSQFHHFKFTNTFCSKKFHHALLCNSVYYGCHTLPTIFITVIYIHVYVCTTKSTYPNCAHSGL